MVARGALVTTVVGSYPQPGWLIDRERLGERLPPRVRARELWRVPEPFLQEAQDDATRLAVLDLERAGVDVIGDGEIQGFRVTAAGLNARIPQAIPGLVSGEAGLAAIDAHAIQPFYTGLLARSCGLSVALVPDGDRIVITAG